MGLIIDATTRFNFDASYKCGKSRECAVAAPPFVVARDYHSSPRVVVSPTGLRVSPHQLCPESKCPACKASTCVRLSCVPTPWKAFVCVCDRCSIRNKNQLLSRSSYSMDIRGRLAILSEGYRKNYPQSHCLCTLPPPPFLARTTRCRGQTTVLLVVVVG